MARGTGQHRSAQHRSARHRFARMRVFALRRPYWAPNLPQPPRRRKRQRTPQQPSASMTWSEKYRKTCPWWPLHCATHAKRARVTKFNGDKTCTLTPGCRGFVTHRNATRSAGAAAALVVITADCQQSDTLLQRPHRRMVEPDETETAIEQQLQALRHALAGFRLRLVQMRNDYVPVADLFQSRHHLFLRERSPAIGIDRKPGHLVSHFFDFLERLGIVFSGCAPIPAGRSAGGRLHRFRAERYFAPQMLEVRNTRQSVNLPVAANDGRDVIGAVILYFKEIGVRIQHGHGVRIAPYPSPGCKNC